MPLLPLAPVGMLMPLVLVDVKPLVPGAEQLPTDHAYVHAGAPCAHPLPTLLNTKAVPTRTARLVGVAPMLLMIAVGKALGPVNCAWERLLMCQWCGVACARCGVRGAHVALQSRGTATGSGGAAFMLLHPTGSAQNCTVMLTSSAALVPQGSVLVSVTVQTTLPGESRQWLAR